MPVSQQLPRSVLLTQHPQGNKAPRGGLEASGHLCQNTRQCPKSCTTYLRHRLCGGDSDRDREREEEEDDEDEDSLAPSELELKERLARLRPALQLLAEGLGESRGLR